MNSALLRILLLVGGASAATSVAAGLSRLGVDIGTPAAWTVRHGPLLVVGFFTTMIGLERAVAFGRIWTLVAPTLAAISGVAQLAGLPAAPWMAAASALGLVVINAAIVSRQAAAFTWLMLAASGLLTYGHVLWAAGRPIPLVVPFWMAFFILTIAAERLELSRMAPVPRWARRLLIAAATLLVVVTMLQSLPTGTAGIPRWSAVAMGCLIAAIGLWQLRFDLARSTVRHPGQTRYIASAVLTGSAWLVPTGALMAISGLPPAGALYDAVLHGVFVGYVFSMVFAHATIVLPAVARLRAPFTPVLYVPLALLHATLIARIVGDLTASFWLRRVGAVGNAAALVLFAATMTTAAMRASRVAHAA